MGQDFKMSSYVSLVDLLTDPIYRGPIWGALFMSISASLMGAINVVRKKPLVSEMLSHACFPGVVLGTMMGAMFFTYSDTLAFIFILIGASLFSLLSHVAFEKLIQNKLKSDVALCYLGASFLGLGVLLASFMQKSHVMWYSKIQVFFYGQASTMSDTHIWIYAGLSCIIALFLILFYRPIRLVCFDPEYARSIGIQSKGILIIQSTLLTLSIVVGIRSVGIVLMTGMLIAPCIAARYLTSRFSVYLVVSLIFGVVSTLCRNILAINWPFALSGSHFVPTGPTTVIVASTMAFIVMLLSPKKGLLGRYLRRRNFQKRCLRENILKAFWKKEKKSSFSEVYKWNLAPSSLVKATLKKLTHQGFIDKRAKVLTLTEDGRKKAAYIVRLHRLWELYLAEHLEYSPEDIHKNAEEIEHLITPEIEEKLTRLLANPQLDPHNKPIPQKELI